MGSNYPRVNAKDVCEITSSKRIYASDYVDNGIPFYRGKEIIEKQRGLVDVSTKLYISEEKYLKIKEKFGAPESGDILLTSVGTLGVPYVVKPNDSFYFKDGNLVWFRKLTNIASKYLYYWMLSPMGKAELKKCTIGASQAAFTIILLKNIEIVLPPLKIQNKIAAILSAYDELIENNLRRIKILEEMAQNLYREWFVNFRFPGHENTRFVDSPLGRIPEGWEVSIVENAFAILGGGTPSKKVDNYWNGGDINWYTPSDLTANKSMFMDASSQKITELGLKKSSAKIFPPFSVMMTSRATLGVVSINTTEACTNQGFITCIPNDKFPLYMLYFWLKNNVENFINHASGATFKEISKGVFKTIEVRVPPNEISKKFEILIQPIGLEILNLQRKNRYLRQTRDLLLPKLISGEVDVSELDINVPEEVSA